jgi:signal transduction histidine kinase
MGERGIRLWRLFIWGRSALSGLFLLVLFVINGFTRPARLDPIFALATLQCLAPIPYLYFLKQRTTSLLGYIAFSLEIVLITLLILGFGNDGYVFLLAYLWPLIMAGWFLGQRTVLPLALFSSLAYGALIVLRNQDLIYSDQVLMPDGATPQALILAALYLGFSSLLLWALMAEKERGERALDRHNRQLATLVQAGSAVVSRQALGGLLNTIIEQAGQLTGIERLGIYLREEQGLVYGHGRDFPADLPPPDLDLSLMPHTQPANRGASGVWPRLSPARARSLGAASGRQDNLVCVPLRGSQGTIGALALLPEPEQQPDEQTRNILEIYGSQVGVSLENARLIEDLRRETESLSAILTHMSEGVFVIGPERQVLLANRAAGEMLDIHTGQKAPPILADALGDVQADQGRAPRLILHVGERVVSLSSATLSGLDGQPESALYVARDSTHEARVEQMKSDFVAYASHELRTPLTTIKMLVGLLLTHQLKEAKQREYLAIMETQVERQTRLVNNLLDLTRLESGHFELVPERMALSQVMEPVIAALSTSAAAKNINLRYESWVEEPLYANASGLEQIVTNLIGNAIKFTEPGGHVTISCRQDNDNVWISVRDTGIGLAPEERQRIFDKFYTARHPKKKGEGTGLGLAISLMIAQEMGGTIQVESELGQGATFTLVLPRKIVPVSATTAA